MPELVQLCCLGDGGHSHLSLECQDLLLEVLHGRKPYGSLEAPGSLWEINSQARNHSSEGLFPHPHDFALLEQHGRVVRRHGKEAPASGSVLASEGSEEALLDGGGAAGRGRLPVPPLEVGDVLLVELFPSGTVKHTPRHTLRAAGDCGDDIPSAFKVQHATGVKVTQFLHLSFRQTTLGGIQQVVKCCRVLSTGDLQEEAGEGLRGGQGCKRPTGKPSEHLGNRAAVKLCSFNDGGFADGGVSSC
mmetsp:Transcript_12538/g.35234  ORF Transcript_12538/g.35234 Transcript_12538/m.35234 type:complete len:246 (+) Transcript_12538:1688-2425(+)